MSIVTTHGDNSPGGIRRHFERKTKDDCIREIQCSWGAIAQLRTELETVSARNVELQREFYTAKAELDQERERVKLLRSALKLTSSRLTSMYTTIEEDALIHRALSAGEGVVMSDFASDDIHKREFWRAISTSRRRCGCGCKKRATHIGGCNGIALRTGCELSIRRWAKRYK